MIKIAAGIVLGVLVGAGCRWLDIPLPAPPKLIGALLVVAMTFGYMATDRFLSQRPATTADLCGGPSGETIASKVHGDGTPSDKAINMAINRD